MDHVDKILAQWHRERPDLDVGPMGLLGRLNRLSRLVSRETEKTFANYGLTASSFDVLATLRRSGPPYGLSPGDLLNTMMITSGTMTNRIDQLEKAGLVRRAQNPDDGRSVIISLTDKGFTLIEAAIADHVATQARLTAALSPEDRETLTGLLRAFLGGVDEEG